MRSKGQFSMIAALLVAVVLISTVIITYSTIRNFPTGEQPKVLNAIDETNFALKQILGFTLGYYGSVLQVTGDWETAYDLSYKYLVSGLDYIARTHPDWAASFNLKNVDLEAYWFTSQSYSRANITVEYNLTGLGVYGITYTTSCKLSVKILGTAGNMSHICVTADENDEPVINLGKSNFKFYLYRFTNSTWNMTSPSKEPIAIADGIYMVEIPSEVVDPYSYVVQVQDSRGIVTVASSFSRYTITLTWNSTMYSLTGATTITVNQTLIDRESFEGNWPPSGWTENPSSSNWNREQDWRYHGSYSADFDGPNSGSAEGYLISPSLNCHGANAIYVDFWYRDDGCDDNEFLLQYYNGTAWKTVADLGKTSSEGQSLRYQEKITDIQYFHQNFRIRWYAHLERRESAYVDYVTITVSKTVTVGGEIQPIVVELLQNGTMRWLGENLQLTTQAKPIPPVPVKAIHVNQTIKGVDYEVPFQIEEWASEYRVPLGLANNASVFSNRNMIVFLVNPNVSKITIWWNGSDTAIQTPYAYLNRYFNDDPPRDINDETGTLNNGMLTLNIDASGTGFAVKSRITQTGIEATANFMRLNNEWSIYGSNPAYTIYNGTVRDIVHAEAEWSGDGVQNCYNFYSHIVLTLPANTTYYTYQLRLVFLKSTDRPRTINDACLIKISVTGASFSTFTENGTLPSGFPMVSNRTGLFYNLSNVWQHHWSQLNSSLIAGAGIMFTDTSNKMLYVFDARAGSKTGALSVSTGSIELCPVTSMGLVSFADYLDLIWYGAVVMFDGTMPILRPDGGGLWIIAEYPPIATVTTES
ncbi:MAG: hypothetical protein RMJ15_00655 [Nitrososphaerota archaeon]|nr:hypothetical protein [Nitrososphaerota archaeon]